jgi:hypothetical protein
LPWELNEDPDTLDKKTFQCKWTGKSEILDLLRIPKTTYYEALLKKLFKEASLNDLETALDMNSEETMLVKQLWKDKENHPRMLFTSTFIKRLTRYAGPETIKEVKQELFHKEAQKYKNWLIDTADFNKNKTSELDHHLKQIQEIWNTLCELENDDDYENKINIVLFFQKEIYDHYRHFFIGKFKPIYFIEPFPAETLVNYYYHKFGSTWPFIPEALTELAVLSRGIFRRFKTYIGLCLDNVTMTRNIQDNSSLLLENVGNNTRERGNSDCKNTNFFGVIVTLLDVQAWIKDKTLVQDLELELHNIFPKQKGLRNITVQLLRELAHGPRKQQEIAEKFFDGYEKGTSRFLGTLEENEYIMRRYEGQDKVISLPSRGEES